MKEPRISKFKIFKDDLIKNTVFDINNNTAFLSEVIDVNIDILNNDYLHELACDLLNLSNDLVNIGYKVFMKIK